MPKLTDQTFRGLVAALFCGYTFWILMTQIVPDADQGLVWGYATQFLDGNYSAWQPGSYMYQYPHQNGMMVFFALVQTIFGTDNILIPQFLNLIFAVISVFFIGALVKKIRLFDGDRGVILALLLFAPFMLYIVFVYGTIPGLAFACAGLYYQAVSFEHNQMRYALLAVLFYIVATLIKSNYLVFLLVGVALFLFHSIYRKEGLHAILAVALLGGYLLSNLLLTAGLQLITGEELIDKGVPKTAYIAMGLQEGPRGAGWYNSYVEQYDGTDPQAMEEQASQDIQERLQAFGSDPAYAATFFAQKIVSIWAEPTFQSLWIEQVRSANVERTDFVNSLLTEGGVWNSIYTQVYDLAQSFIYSFSLVFLIAEARRLSIYQLIPGIVFLAGFLYHIIGEAKSQYTFVYFIFLIPYAIKGYQWVVHRLARQGLSSRKRRK